MYDIQLNYLLDTSLWHFIDGLTSRFSRSRTDRDKPIENTQQPCLLAITMTSGQIQLHTFGFHWLLTTMYIMRVSQCSIRFALIIQRSRLLGGVLTVSLDNMTQLIPCSAKDVTRNIIRLQYGPNNKVLVLRANNPNERQQWITAIMEALMIRPTIVKTERRYLSKLKTALSASTMTMIAPSHWHKIHHVASTTATSRLSFDPNSSSDGNLPSVAGLSAPLCSLESIKRLTDSYDNLAHQWTQVAMETRKFHQDLSKLHSAVIDTEQAVARCAVC